MDLNTREIASHWLRFVLLVYSRTDRKYHLYVLEAATGSQLKTLGTQIWYPIGIPISVLQQNSFINVNDKADIAVKTL